MTIRTLTTMQRLVSLQCNLDRLLARDIFGDQMGSHLFDKFLRLQNNIIHWYNSLDIQNKKIVARYIDGRQGLDGLDGPDGPSNANQVKQSPRCT